MTRTGQAAGGRPQVSIVDDHVHLADNLAEILAGAGYHVAKDKKPVDIERPLTWVAEARGRGTATNPGH